LYTSEMGLLHRLFGRGEVTSADVVARVRALESGLRLLETEQQTMHDQVRKWMRRAVAAERRAEGATPAQSETLPGAMAGALDAHGGSRRRLNWRQRLESRRAAARAASDVASGTTNGEGV